MRRGLLVKWKDLRDTIASGREVNCGRIVCCEEGTFCGKCAAPLPIVMSTCLACRRGGLNQPIQVVETRRKETAG